MEHNRRQSIVENILLSCSTLAIIVTGMGLWRVSADRPVATSDLISVRGASIEGPAPKNKIEVKNGVTILVNKDNPLPVAYIPDSLVLLRLPGSEEVVAAEVIVEPLQKLFVAAERMGHELSILSAYRSYADQKTVYQSFVDGYSQDYADAVSARPGYSEHQTGLAVDIGIVSGECELEACFGSTDAGRWIAANAHLFGFVVRYQENKQTETGYAYEPWHLRYLGESLATELFTTKKTYEEYLAGY